MGLIPRQWFTSWRWRHYTGTASQEERGGPISQVPKTKVSTFTQPSPSKQVQYESLVPEKQGRGGRKERKKEKGSDGGCG
jgi:hypothetical protein